MGGIGRMLFAAAIAAVALPRLAAAEAPVAKAGFATPPAVTIGHWRTNA